MTYNFYKGLNFFESLTMDVFIKLKVKEICSSLSSKENQKDSDKYLSKPEIPYVVRCFLQFPSQQDIVNDVIPAIEKLETNHQKLPQNCEIEAIEKYMVDLLKKNTYASYDKDLVLKAYKVLDSNNEGYLDLRTILSLFKNFGLNKFSKQNLKEMEDFCIEYENDLLDPLPIEENQDTAKKHDQYTNRKFYYENYYRKLEEDNNKRFKSLMDEFLNFKENYVDPNVFSDEIKKKKVSKPKK